LKKKKKLPKYVIIILRYVLQVHQATGERNFHIFYQLLEGADEATLKRFSLEKTPDRYFYTAQVQFVKCTICTLIC